MTLIRPELRVVQQEPFNAETPLNALTTPVTPTELFFVRSNFAVPRIDGAEWRLRVDGLVGRPLALSLAELMSLGATEVTTVLECAGNGRRLMSPVPGGTPWELGAVSAGTFEGVPLATVLSACDVDPAAVEIVFRGADSGAVDGDRVVRFERSLPLARALDRSTLLAWSLNGAPLTPEHGYPVRLLVPGWYGVASVKWLERITAVDAPFAGHFQAERYVYVGDASHDENAAVTHMRVRSLIAEPRMDAIVGGAIIVRGWAWSGNGAVTRVRLSDDGGGTWMDARLGAAASPSAPTLWECEWTPRGAGTHELIARAEDASGAMQPLEPVWNGLGYANNVVQRVRVMVR